MGGISSSFKAMGGGKGALKKMFLNTAAPLSKQNLAMNKKEYDTVMKPAPLSPEEMPKGAPKATFSEDPELAEEARRRRLARRAPVASVLSSGNDQSLGG